MWQWFGSPNASRLANAIQILGFVLVAGAFVWDRLASVEPRISLTALWMVAAGLILFGSGYYVIEFAITRGWIRPPADRFLVAAPSRNQPLVVPRGRFGPPLYEQPKGPVPPNFTRFHGRVIDEKDEPIAGVCVYAGPPAGCPKVGTPKTDGWGTWAVDYPSGTRWLFNFERDGFNSVVGQLATDANPEINIQMQRTL